MTLPELLHHLSDAPAQAPVMCHLEHPKLRSRIYIVGQVQPSVPGAVLGNREPYLREKDAGTLTRELTTFGPRFHHAHFLLEHTEERPDGTYMVRYYRVDRVDVGAEEVVLVSTRGAVEELSEHHSV